jgi:hypothetical protein
MSRPFGRLIAKTTSKRRLRSGRGRRRGRRAISRGFRGRSRISRSFRRSFRRSCFFNSSRLFHRRRLAAGRDAEGENSSGRSRHAQLELSHRYYPSSQRQGLPPTREATPCQGLTEMASATREQDYAYLHSSACLNQDLALGFRSCCQGFFELREAWLQRRRH